MGGCRSAQAFAPEKKDRWGISSKGQRGISRWGCQSGHVHGGSTVVRRVARVTSLCGSAARGPRGQAARRRRTAGGGEESQHYCSFSIQLQMQHRSLTHAAMIGLSCLLHGTRSRRFWAPSGSRNAKRSGGPPASLLDGAWSRRAGAPAGQRVE
jgi:hypothetical protein